jgi:hypothetical protein
MGKKVNALKLHQLHNPTGYGFYDNDEWDKEIDKLSDILVAIGKEIELYHEDDEFVNKGELSKNKVTSIESSKNEDVPIIFLSHSSSDKKFGDALRNFIVSLGVKDTQLIYTSHSLHKVPLGTNFLDYIRDNLQRNIFMIILWSNEYLESVACLTEMGAAWVLRRDYTHIFVPTFNFKNPKFHDCVIDTKKNGIKLDDNCKAGMIELKNKLEKIFNLSNDETRNTLLLDTFMKEIS